MPYLLHADAYFELLNVMQALTGIVPVPKIDPAKRGEMLESIARALEEARGDIVAVAAQETALLPAELEPEFARMTGTFRMFAEVVREGSWVRAAISRRGEGSLGPNHDIRSMLEPLGPVAVFGASNFPLAYGVCGGDTASALAAGCAVVVKEHPAHPKTGRLILARAHEGLRRAGHREAMIGYVGNLRAEDLGPAQELVKHELIKALGFTGSRRGGLALEDLARSRADRIPVFAEMGSANPVVITPRAAQVRGAEIAKQIGDSVLSRFGQQCTCPGIIVVPDAKGAGRAFVDALTWQLNAAAPRDMLAPWIRDSYVRRLSECAAVPGVRMAAGVTDPLGARGARAAALITTADRLAWHVELREEIFGPGVLLADAPMEGLLSLVLPASLTLSIYFESNEPADVELARRLVAVYGGTAGRIILNGVPTGVRVGAGMVHGGPFPATNRPESTAVGPMAMERWCRPVCWQNAPDELLPPELRDGNPLGIRRVEG